MVVGLESMWFDSDTLGALSDSLLATVRLIEKLVVVVLLVVRLLESRMKAETQSLGFADGMGQ
jgi:hypothetical protein